MNALSGKMVKIFFVVGTHTGIGKTIFSALLTRKLKAVYVKPVETGGKTPEDTTFVGKAGAYKSINIYHFQRPISPHIAGEFDLKKILRKIREIINTFSPKRPVVVESAGGLMTPLRANYTWLDFAKDLQKIEKTHVILVAGNYLGVLNHILLTFSALEKEGIEPIGFVLNSFERESHISQKLQEEAVKKLRFRFFGKKIGDYYLGKIPFMNGIEKKLIDGRKIKKADDIIHRLIGRIV